jgi:hypothetical protein
MLKSVNSQDLWLIIGLSHRALRVNLLCQGDLSRSKDGWMMLLNSNSTSLPFLKVNSAPYWPSPNRRFHIIMLPCNLGIWRSKLVLAIIHLIAINGLGQGSQMTTAMTSSALSINLGEYLKVNGAKTWVGTGHIWRANWSLGGRMVRINLTKFLSRNVLCKETCSLAPNAVTSKNCNRFCRDSLLLYSSKRSRFQIFSFWPLLLRRSL